MEISKKVVRLYLNLGHTIGHAIEVNTVIDGNEKHGHGEGVSLSCGYI